MKTLAELLLTETKRPEVVADSEQLIKDEVAGKSGVTGLLIKGAFKMVNALKPKIIHESVDALLDDFVKEMEPFYVRFQEEKAVGGIESFLVQHADEIAEKLIGITDKRAERSTNKVIKSAYNKLRPQGKKQVAGAMPRVGKMVAKHGA